MSEKKISQRGMNKIVIVTQKTRLSDLVARYNTVEQARFYIEHMGMSFDEYIDEDRIYNEALGAVIRIASEYARVQTVDRDFVPNMLWDRSDVVVALGRDGLVVNVLKYLDGQPLLGVNPDPSRNDGILLPFTVDDFEVYLKKTLAGTAASKAVTMAMARTNDGQKLYAVNDLFIGNKTHVSARYEITCKGETEQQSSSGIIVSTGLGSSGWYASVIAEASRISEMFGGRRIEPERRSWDDGRLVFTVREPFPSRVTGTGIVIGTVDAGDSLVIASKMPTNGVIFSDGIEADAIEFNSGTEVTVTVADKSGRLITR